MRKERTFNVKLLLGDTWEETERKVLMARHFCDNKNEIFNVEIHYKDLTKFQLDHIRHGVVPFSSRIIEISDKLSFIDEDDSVKILKHRDGQTDATIS